MVQTDSRIRLKSFLAVFMPCSFVPVTQIRNFCRFAVRLRICLDARKKTCLDRQITCTFICIDWLIAVAGEIWTKSRGQSQAVVVASICTKTRRKTEGSRPSVVCLQTQIEERPLTVGAALPAAKRPAKPAKPAQPKPEPQLAYASPAAVSVAVRRPDLVAGR